MDFDKNVAGSEFHFFYGKIELFWWIKWRETMENTGYAHLPILLVFAFIRLNFNKFLLENQFTKTINSFLGIHSLVDLSI